jgi:hypothetical protein
MMFDMSAPSNSELEQAAREQLASGLAAPDVLVRLLAAGVDPTQAAVAVCVAAGSPGAEAERRLVEFDGLWELMEPGEEAEAADLLARQGYFEPDAVLDEQQQEIAARLQLVLTTVGGVPSGFAPTLFKYLRTGHLAKAFIQLEWLGSMRWKDNEDFWTAMCRVGEAFPDEDADLDAARLRCFERLIPSSDHDG